MTSAPRRGATDEELERRRFDLNTEDVLEHWTVIDALREVIANALDEQALTGTSEPTIIQDRPGRWRIRDQGRGLAYGHLTQNESKEKLAHPEKVVGKFGVGLKDALATFDRHGVAVTIRSRHGEITTCKQSKHGFDDLHTLHALIDRPSDPAMIGTEFILEGEQLTERVVSNSKQLFLRYAGDEAVAETKFGAAFMRQDGPARIYVSGLRVATEDNFLFSYNIVSPPKGASTGPQP